LHVDPLADSIVDICPVGAPLVGLSTPHDRPHTVATNSPSRNRAGATAPHVRHTCGQVGGWRLPGPTPTPVSRRHRRPV